jgi:hypothetical protein
VTVDYWNPKKNKMTSTRWNSDSNELKDGIYYFDRFFRKWYLDKFKVNLPSVFGKKQSSYTQLLGENTRYAKAF